MFVTLGGQNDSWGLGEVSSCMCRFMRVLWYGGERGDGEGGSCFLPRSLLLPHSDVRKYARQALIESAYCNIDINSFSRGRTRCRREKRYSTHRILNAIYHRSAGAHVH